MYVPSTFELSIVVACGFFWFYGWLSKKITGPTPRSGLRIKISSPVFVSRYVSIVHSVTISTLSVLYLTGVLPYEWWRVCQCIPVGYCIYDTILVYGKTQLYLKVERVTPIHHFIFAVSSLWLFERYPLEVTVGYLAELSNPFLHISYHLLHTPHMKQYPRLFVFSSVALIATFLVFRVGTFGYLLYRALFHESPGLFVVLGIGALFVMNVNWFWRLLRKAKYHLLPHILVSPENAPPRQ